MKKILFISYYFSPINTSGSLRNSKLAKYLARSGWEVFALSTSNKMFFNREDMIGGRAGNLKISTIPTFDYQTMKLLLLGLNRIFRRKVIRFRAQENPFQFSLVTLFDMLPFHFLVGEGGLLFIVLGLIKSVYLIKKEKIKNLYTSFSPFSDLFLGFILKLLFPKLRWAADFGDPHIIKEKNLLSRITVAFDRLILKNADFLTTVSRGYAENIRKYKNTNIRILRNGFDPDEMKEKAGPGKIRDFSIAHIGALYGERRDPRILFQCLAGLIKEKKINRKDVRLVYAGREGGIFKSACRRYGLEDRFADKGFIRREESLAIQKRSYFLLLLTWAEKGDAGVIPGKYYEYLISGRPVICIISGNRDKEIDEIFKKTNSGIVVYSNDPVSAAGLKKFLIRHYARYRAGRYHWQYNKREIDRFSYKFLAEELAGLYV